jgi:hypothetical protein
VTTNQLLLRIALAGITAAGVAAPAASVAAPRTVPDAWAVVAAPSPGSVQNTLFSITRMPHGGIWAVGDRVSTSSPRFIALLVEHWTGSRWVAQVLPGHQTALLAAYSPARNNLWAVGFFRVGIGAFETVPVIDHFNGRTWTTVSAPHPAASVLTGIGGTSATDMWATGRQMAHDGAVTIIEHYDGHRWTRVPSPSPDTDYLDLGAIAAISRSDVWVAGDYTGSDSVSRTLVEHYDGQAWSIVPSPNLGKGSNYLTALTVLDGRPWAVGRANDGATYRPLALHWSGRAWSGQLLPRSGSGDEALNAVATAGRTLWAVGNKTNAAGTQRTLIMRHDKGAWTVMASPNLRRKDNVLYGVVSGHRAMWAVGSASSKALTTRLLR